MLDIGEDGEGCWDELEEGRMRLRAAKGMSNGMARSVPIVECSLCDIYKVQRENYQSLTFIQFLKNKKQLYEGIIGSAGC